jgi:hypothetical protein
VEPTTSSGGWMNKPPARAEKPVLKKFWAVEKNFQVHFCEISGRFLPCYAANPRCRFLLFNWQFSGFPAGFPKKQPCNQLIFRLLRKGSHSSPHLT